MASPEPRCRLASAAPERDSGEAWEVKPSRQPPVETQELLPRSLACFCRYTNL